MSYTTIHKLNNGVRDEWAEQYRNGYLSDSLDDTRESVREGIDGTMIYTADIRALWIDADEPEPECMGETISDSIAYAVAEVMSQAVHNEANWCDARDEAAPELSDRLGSWFNEHRFELDSEEDERVRELVAILASGEATIQGLDADDAHSVFVEAWEFLKG